MLTMRAVWPWNGGGNGIEPPVVYSDHLAGDGQQMFEHAAKLNFEGIVSKRADAIPLLVTSVQAKVLRSSEP